MNKKKYQKTLFIFRRDLRLEDNTGLIYALENSKLVVPCFIFTPEQIDHNPYRGDHCVQFMLESLEDLEMQLKKKGARLYLFHGSAHEMVKDSIKALKLDCIVANRDYTPYSQKRDKQIAQVCKKQAIPFILCDDALLHSPESSLKPDGKPYSIFTPFYRNASRLQVAHPKQNRYQNYFHGAIPFCANRSLFKKILPKRLNLAVKGGRSEGLKILKRIADYKKYSSVRDFPSQNGTTHLSSFLKFTLLSPREIYEAISKRFGKHHELIRALYWRDFFSTVAFFFPHVFKGAFHKKYNQLKWNYDKKAFKRWCQGKTGFPIVDAGMRELNETGFMHNRVRMITASFLVKDLHIDWRWGEKYFAKQLSDYDPAINNGNWQWIASTGCDAQPYFRIFNPWNQQIKFDKDCTYIKKWVPELALLSPKEIHEWNKEKMHSLCKKYPPPMVDHAKEAKKSIHLY